MATHGEKIDELMKLVATLDERLNNHREEVKGLRPDIHKNTASLIQISEKITNFEQLVGELRSCRENLVVVQKEIAHLQVNVKGIQDQTNRSGSRWWAFWTSVVAALIGAAVSGLITYFATRA